MSTVHLPEVAILKTINGNDDNMLKMTVSNMYFFKSNIIRNNHEHIALKL